MFIFTALSQQHSISLLAFKQFGVIKD